MSSLEKVGCVVGILLGVPTLFGLAYAGYSHFAKAADVELVADKFDKRANSLEERLFKQQQDSIDTLRLQREERNLPPNPQWLKRRQLELDRERCLYRKRFNPSVTCTN